MRDEGSLGVGSSGNRDEERGAAQLSRKGGFVPPGEYSFDHFCEQLRVFDASLSDAKLYELFSMKDQHGNGKIEYIERTEEGYLESFVRPGVSVNPAKQIDMYMTKTGFWWGRQPKASRSFKQARTQLVSELTEEQRMIRIRERAGVMHPEPEPAPAPTRPDVDLAKLSKCDIDDEIAQLRGVLAQSASEQELEPQPRPQPQPEAHPEPGFKPDTKPMQQPKLKLDTDLGSLSKSDIDDEIARLRGVLAPEPEPEPEHENWAWHEEHRGLTTGVEPALRRVLWQAIHSQKRTLYGHPCHDLRSFWEAVSQRGDAGVRKWELQEAMDRMGLGLSDQQHHRLLLTLDTDMSGLVSFNEFKFFMGSEESHRHKAKGKKPVSAAGPTVQADDSPAPPSEPEPHSQPEPQPKVEAKPEAESTSKELATVAQEAALAAPLSLGAAVRRRGPFGVRSASAWDQLLREATVNGIALPDQLVQCEENWAWVVAALDGTIFRCQQLQREAQPWRPPTDQTLWKGLQMRKQRDLTSWETATWGKAMVQRIRAWEDSRNTVAYQGMQMAT
jgi:Ca2+-binding EF-hand superfamily protein